ncbi:MAG: hypothetical protein ACRD9R_06635 [Pyrinomonadaceae bacterium]
MENAEPRHPSAQADAEEATLITPRFDADETVSARPVVPLVDGSSASPTALLRRRRFSFGLLFLAALIGGVVSVLGYSLYQQQRQQTPKVSGTAAQPNTTADDRNETAPAVVPAATLAEREVAIIETVDESESGKSEAAERAVPKKAGPASKERGGREVTPKSAPRVGDAKENARRAEESDDDRRARLSEEREARRSEIREERRAARARRRAENADDDGPFTRPRQASRERESSAPDAPRRRRNRRDGDGSPSRIRDIFEGPPPA